MSDIHDMKLRRLDFSLLLVFQEVYRRQRANAAAGRLGLSQPAISHALARLRDALGDPLFERRPEGLRPTPAAVAFAPKIDLLLSMANDILGSTKTFDPATSQRCFKISANDYGAALLTAPVAAAMSVQAPFTQLAVNFAGGKLGAIGALRNGDIDLAVGLLPHQSADIVTDHLFMEDFQVIARKDHPAIKGESGLDLDLYLKLDHLIVSYAGDLRGTVDEVLERMGLRRRVMASSPMFLGSFATVAESDLIATMPRRLVRRYARIFDLQIYEMPFSMTSFPVDLLTMRRETVDPGTRWLAEEVRRALLKP